MAQPKKVHKIHKGLLPLMEPIDAVVAKDRNPNKGDVEALARSLARYGQRKPLVANVRGKVTEAGHTLHDAAVSLGWTHLAILWVDDDPASELGFALADNRTRDLAVYDEELLASWVTDLAAMDGGIEILGDSGFDEDDLSDFMSDVDGLDDGMMGSPAKTPGDRADSYEAANVRSVLLPFGLTRYAWVVRQFAALRAELGFDNNADVVATLIADRVGEAPPADA